MNYELRVPCWLYGLFYTGYCNLANTNYILLSTYSCLVELDTQQFLFHRVLAQVERWDLAHVQISVSPMYVTNLLEQQHPFHPSPPEKTNDSNHVWRIHLPAVYGAEKQETCEAWKTRISSPLGEETGSIQIDFVAQPAMGNSKGSMIVLLSVSGRETCYVSCSGGYWTPILEAVIGNICDE